MNYWILRADAPGGAVIDALPEGSPAGWKFHKGEHLAQQFPAGGRVAFSDHFPERRKLFDFVRNTLSVLIVSPRVQQTIKSLNIENVEFLPVTVCDHQWKPVSEGHAILNVLGSEDAIDMENSTYELSSLSQQISSISNLVLRKDRISPRVDLFRASTMMRLMLMSDRLHDALSQQGVTGLQAYPADGFDDTLI